MTLSCNDTTCVQGLMVAVAAEVTLRLADSEQAAHFRPQHLTNLAWAYAALEAEAPSQLMDSLASAITARVKQCNAQELVSACWAFAKLGEPLSQ